jgi:hypothetical protein
LGAAGFGSGIGFDSATFGSAGLAVGAGVLDFASVFGSVRAGGDASGGATGDVVTGGAGIIVVESFFSAADLSPSGLSLGDRSDVDGGIDVDGALGDFVEAVVRGAGGGFIQSSRYGTATAPTTPSTITTRTTRNHVAAKIDRGGTSSYSS